MLLAEDSKLPRWDSPIDPALQQAARSAASPNEWNKLMSDLAAESNTEFLQQPGADGLQEPARDEPRKREAARELDDRGNWDGDQAGGPLGGRGDRTNQGRDTVNESRGRGGRSDVGASDRWQADQGFSGRRAQGQNSDGDGGYSTGMGRGARSNPGGLGGRGGSASRGRAENRYGSRGYRDQEELVGSWQTSARQRVEVKGGDDNLDWDDFANTAPAAPSAEAAGFSKGVGISVTGGRYKGMAGGKVLAVRGGVVRVALSGGQDGPAEVELPATDCSAQG